MSTKKNRNWCLRAIFFGPVSKWCAGFCLGQAGRADKPSQGMTPASCGSRAHGLGLGFQKPEAVAQAAALGGWNQMYSTSKFTDRSKMTTNNGYERAMNQLWTTLLYGAYVTCGFIYFLAQLQKIMLINITWKADHGRHSPLPYMWHSVKIIWVQIQDA